MNFGVFGTVNRRSAHVPERMPLEVSLGSVGNSLSEIVILCNDYYSYA